MESNKKMDKKTKIKSIVFVVLFWPLTALMFYGFFKLFDAIDLSGFFMHILGK